MLNQPLPHTSGLGILQTALQAPPLLTLNFYPFGILMSKSTPLGKTEYPVSPSEVATMLSKRPVTWETGILSANTVYLSERGSIRVVAEYREAQMTGVWVEGSDKALRVPMPGLLLIRTVTGGQPDYRLFAVKERPSDLKATLYSAPLPNVYDNGGICWGSVARPVGDALESTTLAKDWSYLLGTRFSDHGVRGKSKTNKDDIRKKLIALEKRGVKRYPLSDLMEAGHKLDKQLQGRDE